MKLNPDCIRSVMLVLEDELSIIPAGRLLRFNGVTVEDLICRMRSRCDFADHDIAYSVLQLKESGYIVASNDSYIDFDLNLLNLGLILYITPKGHEFIASVQDQTVWSKKVKPILDILGGVSLSIIETVSKGIANAAIDHLILTPSASTP